MVTFIKRVNNQTTANEKAPLSAEANNSFTVDKRPKVRVKEVFPKCFIHVEIVQGDMNSVMVLTSPVKETRLKVQVVDLLLRGRLEPDVEVNLAMGYTNTHL